MLLLLPFASCLSYFPGPIFLSCGLPRLGLVFYVTKGFFLGWIHVETVTTGLASRLSCRELDTLSLSPLFGLAGVGLYFDIFFILLCSVPLPDSLTCSLLSRSASYFGHGFWDFVLDVDFALLWAGGWKRPMGWPNRARLVT